MRGTDRESTSVETIRETCADCGQALPLRARFCPFCAAPARAVQDPTDTAELPIAGSPITVAPEPANPDVHRFGSAWFRLIALAGGAVVLVLAMLLAATLGKEAPAEVDAGTIAAAASEAGSGPFALAMSSARLEQVRRVGDTARAAVTAVRSQLPEANRVENNAERRGLVAFLQAELTLLETLERLAVLDEEESDRWPGLAVAAEEALERFTRAADALPDPVATVPDQIIDQAGRAVPIIGATLISMSDRLAEWRSAVETARRDRESGRISLEAYAGPFRAQMERYGALRGAVAEHVAKMATTSYEQDLRFFEEARRDRHAVREAMSGFTAPEVVGAAHSGVTAAVDRSIGALDAAVEGLRYALAFRIPYPRTAGWQRFEAESDDISDDWRAAVAGWDLSLIHI